MNISLVFMILVGVGVAAAAGYLGSFMVVKRMSLVGDALSHVALPGMALALSWRMSPILGAFVALALGVILVWYLGETTTVYPEALVGVLFTASLALGILITPEPELLEALFGDIQTISAVEGAVAICLSIFIMILTRVISGRLILGVVSEELARVSKVEIGKVNLIYLLLVGAVVALGVQFVGTLLMGALVIVPAASAKNISRGLSDYYFYSVLFGMFAAAAGIMIGSAAGVAVGPVVVLTSILIFLLSYVFKR